jgi:hypothetical protein
MRPWLLVPVVVLFVGFPATANPQPWKSVATAVAKGGAKAASTVPKAAAPLRRTIAGPRGAAAAGFVVADDGAVAAGRAVGDEGALAVQASVRGSADDGVAAAAEAPKSRLRETGDLVWDRAKDKAQDKGMEWVGNNVDGSAAPDVASTPGSSAPIAFALVVPGILALAGLGILMWVRARRKSPQ